MVISNYDEKNVPIIINYFRTKGINDNGIAGLLGNLYSESRLYTNNLQNSCEKKLAMTDEEYTSAVDLGRYAGFSSDRAGYGLAQWTSEGRKTGLYNYAKSHRKSIADINMQLEWLYTELSTKYKGVLSELVSPTNTIRSCAEIVVCKFEIPRSVINGGTERQATIDKRTEYAQDFYDLYLKKSTTNSKPIKPVSNVSFTIPQIIFTNSDCYKDNYKMTPKGIIVHSTGCNNPNIRRYVAPDDGVIGENYNGNHWNNPGINKCVHAFIGYDKNGNVTGRQTLPWDICCWGCGRWQLKDKNGRVIEERGSYNYPPTAKHPMDTPYIQFEICEDDLTDANYFNNVMDYAMSLCSYLCEKYNISVDNIRSHHEAYLMSMASNHADIDHWLAKFNKNMDWFRNGVKAKMTNDISQRTDLIKYICNGKESLASIATKHKTTKKVLMDLNNLPATGKLDEGTVIYIPVAAPVVKEEPVKIESVSNAVNVDKAASVDKENLSRTFITTHKVNVRSGAGVAKRKLDELAAGTSVRCYGFYTSVLGTKWLLVQYKINGETKTGFISSLYLS